MRLSFADEESFKESVGSLNFNYVPSDPDSLQSGSMLPEERDEAINEDPNHDILEVQREPARSRSPSQERSEDT